MANIEDSSPHRRIPSRRELRARQAQQALQAQQNAEKFPHTEPEIKPGDEDATTAVENVSEVVEPVLAVPSSSLGQTATQTHSAPNGVSSEVLVRSALSAKAERSQGGLTETFREETVEEIAKRNRSKRFKNFVATLLVLLAIAGVVWLGVILAGKLLNTGSGVADYQGNGAGGVTVEIPMGATGESMAVALVDKDVVASREAFITAFSANPEARTIQPGTYKLASQMSAAAAVAALLDPANRIDSGITIPEGYTVAQIAKRLVDKGEFSAAEVDSALSNPDSLGLPPEANGNLEGWIAPATYNTTANQKVADLLRTMVQTNIDRLQRLNVPRERWQEVLTKGSILEREVNNADYLGKVARVIDNRLDPEKGKPVLNKLQMDSTVSYAVKRSSGIPTKSELEQDSPYNTYRNAGLPPTPIGTVGEKAIKAVMNPEPGDWLYFVTVNLETGETKFYNSYEEFLKGKSELQEYCKADPNKC